MSDRGKMQWGLVGEKASKEFTVVDDSKKVGERVDYRQVGGVYNLGERERVGD